MDREVIAERPGKESDARRLSSSNQVSLGAEGLKMVGLGGRRSCGVGLGLVSGIWGLDTIHFSKRRIKGADVKQSA